MTVLNLEKLENDPESLRAPRLSSRRSRSAAVRSSLDDPRVSTPEQELQARCDSLEQQLSDRDEQLEAMTVRLQTCNNEFEAFVNAVSHDLQTPLRAVCGFSQFLHQEYADQLEETAVSYIERVVDGATRLRQLLSGLILYSRVSTKARPFERVEMNEIVADALEFLKQEIENSNAAVTVAPLPSLEGDPEQLTLLFRNLIDNGLKFHESGPPSVRIEATETADGWTLSVIDNGIGIPPEHGESVFEMFRRLHAPQKYEGVGAGLAVCRRIVERHSGQIWITSEEGSGCSVHMRLPANREAVVAQREARGPL